MSNTNATDWRSVSSVHAPSDGCEQEYNRRSEAAAKINTDLENFVVVVQYVAGWSLCDRLIQCHGTRNLARKLSRQLFSSVLPRAV
ncbi:hypothetical protein OS493_008118 [Desmophyllum pertusum]|uniref:Uncharacterized protein n=1 Tax=Desmophyllum pertusum TaxID=174260 RepID=A0A9X0CGF5_9CNID|nr:hypothetical protein OS493_008118 [Desmophyllum pertusum]